MSKQLVEKVTCECGHVEYCNALLIENLGQFVKINPPLKATVFEAFECTKCGSTNIVDSELTE